jgi:iron complex outermembrane receptor protein
MTMNRIPKRDAAARGLIALGCAVSLFGGVQLAAQSPAPDGQVERLETFVVTGSYIPVAGSATAIPVTTIDSEAIQNTGINTNLLEVLRKTAPQFTGNGNLGNSNADINSGTTGGGSAVAFRNTQTLVLINGRRAAYSPILASGGNQFVDLNLIPLAAIERVELLQDGASAIYGTDAVAGVVNVILKSNYQGAEAGFRYAFSDNDGNYAERKAWFGGGASTEKTSLTVAAEWTKTDPLFQYEREYSAESFGTPTFAGVVNDDNGNYYVLNPSLTAPPLNQNLTLAQLVANGTYIPVSQDDLINGTGNARQYAFNLANYVTLLLGNERSSAVVNFEHKWLPSVTIFGDLLYTETDTYSQLNAQPISARLAANDPTNPSDVPLRARNRFVANPRQYYYDTTSLRGILGLRGELENGFSWEVAANRNRVKQGYRNANLVDTAGRIAAVASGAINLFSRQQPAGAVEASGMLGTAIGSAVSTLETYDYRVTGKLMTLPAGDVGFAVGGDFRTETLSQTADRNSQAATFGWDSGTTLDPFDADRDISSYFLNVRVPIFGGENSVAGANLLEFEGALRHEKYSDTDDPTVPKFTLRWLPFNDELAFRGTYSESFAAPTLFQLFGPGGIGSTSSLQLERFGGGAAITGQANQRNTGNTALRPSESENFTLGVVWSPKSLKGFSISLDYFNIKQTDLVSTYTAQVILQDVELRGAASPYAGYVRFGPADDLTQFDGGTPVTAPGQIGNRPIDTVYVTDPLVNIAYQKLSGLDLKVDYTWNTDSFGRFDLGLAAGYYDSYRVRQVPENPEQETAGWATAYNGTIPEFNTYFNAGWKRGPWGATFGWQHIPSVRDESGVAGDVTADEYVESFNSIDLAVSYTFDTRNKWLRGLGVRVGANNVFNEMPPQAKGTFANGNADIATYGAVGRLLFLEAVYRF